MVADDRWPSIHGATVRKFVIRAIGAAAALGLAVLATAVISPSATNLFPYMIAIFMGVLVMAYVGEAGGLLSYLSIGGTAFLIAFSGTGPRNDAFGSIWTIWGISFGMLIRAVVSIFWPERASRTLVEEFQSPLESMLELVAAAHRRSQDASQVRTAEATLITGLRTMLGIANDAQLEGAAPASMPLTWLTHSIPCAGSASSLGIAPCVTASRPPLRVARLMDRRNRLTLSCTPVLRTGSNHCGCRTLKARRAWRLYARW
jgi:hypothetical protein